MTADPGVALATERLAKKYGSQVALDGLDLRVPTGVVYGFLGPERGRQDHDDADPHRPDPAGQRAGRAARAAVRAGRPQAPVRGRRADRVAVVLPVPVGPREPARPGGDRARRCTRARIDEVLELVNLGERGRDKVSGYSLGMKQRLGIAAALLNDPKLLLLDEPANGLDPAGIVGMRDTLRALAASGKTVFVSSHILSEVQQLADVVGIIGHGPARPRGPDRDAAARGGLGPGPGGARRRCPRRPSVLTARRGRRHGDRRGRPGRRLAVASGSTPTGRPSSTARWRGAGVFASRARGRHQPRDRCSWSSPRRGPTSAAARAMRGRPGGPPTVWANDPAASPSRPGGSNEALRRRPPQARPAARDLGDVPAARRPRRPAVPRADRQLAAGARTRRRSSRRSWS